METHAEKLKRTIATAVAKNKAIKSAKKKTIFLSELPKLKK